MIAAVPNPVVTQPVLPDSKPGLVRGCCTAHSVPVCESGLVTATLTAPPVEFDGVVAVMVVLLTKTILVATLPPKATVAPLRKLAPLMVTAVPPAAGPETGEMLPTVGAGFW